MSVRVLRCEFKWIRMPKNQSIALQLLEYLTEGNFSIGFASDSGGKCK